MWDSDIGVNRTNLWKTQITQLGELALNQRVHQTKDVAGIPVPTPLQPPGRAHPLAVRIMAGPYPVGEAGEDSLCIIDAAALDKIRKHRDGRQANRALQLALNSW